MKHKQLKFPSTSESSQDICLESLLFHARKAKKEDGMLLPMQVAVMVRHPLMMVVCNCHLLHQNGPLDEGDAPLQSLLS